MKLQLFLFSCIKFLGCVPQAEVCLYLSSYFSLHYFLDNCYYATARKSFWYYSASFVQKEQEKEWNNFRLWFKKQIGLCCLILQFYILEEERSLTWMDFCEETRGQHPGN